MMLAKGYKALMAGVAMLALAGTARAQNNTIQGWCQVGGIKAVTQGMISSNTLQGSYPRCSVTVYLTGTSTKATLHTSATGGTLTNPFTANTDGSWLLWTANGAYDVVMVGGTPIAMPYAVTLTDVVIGAGGGGGGGCSTGGIPTTNGSVTGDSSSTNCGTDNRTSDTAGSPSQNQTFGYQVMQGNSGTDNVGIGWFAGDSNTGDINVLIGDSAGANNTGDVQVFIGNSAGQDNTGDTTVGIGENAARKSTSSFSDFIGDNSGYMVTNPWTVGDYWDCMGYDSCQNGSAVSGTLGSYNVGIGAFSAGDVEGNFNVAVGYGGGGYHTSHDVVAIGQGAGDGRMAFATTPTAGHDIVALGQGAGGGSGSNVIAIGFRAITAPSTLVGNSGDHLIAVGDHALTANNTGSGNIAIGQYAGAVGWTTNTALGNSNVTGSNNTWIGDFSGPSTTTQLSDTIAIGSGAHVGASHQTAIGTNTTTSLLIFGCPTGQSVLDDGSGTCYTPGGGGGTVGSVANSDGTLTVSPTTGSVIASLALGHANTWTSKQTQPAPLFSDITGLTQCLHVNSSGQVSGTGSDCGAGGGGVSGSGTTGYLPKWTGSTALGDSAIDDGITTASTLTTHEKLAVADGTGNAGMVTLKQGTPGATAANSVGLEAPASVTAYNFKLPSAQGAGALTNDGSGNTSWTPASGSSSTVIKYASQLGAALNADLNYPGKTPSGGTATDDSAVLNAFLATATASNPVTLIMDGAALACKVHGPQAGNWSIIGQGGGVAQVPITAWSITSNVVTFTTKPQTLVAGQIVSLGGLSSGSFMNGTSLVPIPLRVSATGLTSTSFQAAFTHANASATETGEADFLYGTGFVAPMGCNGDVINNADSSTMYNIIPPEFGANISISNLIINGNRYDGTLGNSTTGDPLGPIVAPPQAYTVWYNDINISATNGVLIDHVWLYNAPSFMFKCNGCNSLQVTNSHFENILPNQAHVAQNGDGIHIDGPSHDIYLANNYIRAMDDGVALNAGEGISAPITRVTMVNITQHDSSSLGRMYTNNTACPSGLFPTVSTVDMTNFSGDAIVVGFEMGLESARTFTTTDMITDVKWSNSTITTQYPMVFMDPTGDITFDNMTWVPTQNNAGFVTTAYNTLSNNSLNFQNVHIKRTGSGFGGVSLLDTVHGYIGGAGTPTFTRLNVNGFQMVDDGGSYSAGGPVLNLNTNATITTLYSGGTNDLTKVANGYLFSPSMAARVTSIATQTLYGDIASNNPLPFTINTPSGSGLFSASPNTVGSHSAIGVGNSSSAHNALYNAWFNTTVPYGSYQTYAAGDPLEYDATFHFFDGGPMSVGISGGFTGASLPTLPGLFNVGTTSQFFVTSAGAATATNITDSALTSGNCVQASTAGLLVTTASPCGSSGGSVTTTGSPVSGNLTKFSGASSITNADLSGDCTTSGTLSVTCTKINGITISGTPATGYVPTATSSSTATWQAASGSSGPLFKQYTYVVDSTATSVTTPAITVATGDLVVASCRFTSGSAGTVTSSPANTFNALTAQTGSGTLVQMSWGIVASGASTTFTCTQSSSTAGISIVVLDYSGTGTTLNTSSGAVGGTETITTTQRTLQVQCGASPSGLAQFIPGVMGGTYGQLVGVSQSTLAATNADQGCQQVVVPWAQPGVASSFTGTTSLTTTAAFNY